MQHLPLACILSASACLLSGCQRIPTQEGRSITRAFTDTAGTTLGLAITPKIGANAGLSGFLPIAEGRDAFAVRSLIVEASERSIDLQYYIWHQDLAGSLLFAKLHAAAARGVRVRLLLDDYNCNAKLDTTLATLDAHPNIEVRLFNPFFFRRTRVLDYLGNFARVNRRMHNKAFIVDNQIAVVGGRNIADEYFDASPLFAYADLDVMVVGPIVPETSREFDAYWASASAHPTASLLPASDPAKAARLITDLASSQHDPRARSYLTSLTDQKMIRDALSGILPMEWARIKIVSDNPAKGMGLAPGEDRFTRQLANVAGEPQRELLLLTPYFVPTKAGADSLMKLARRGVRVAVLTNSLTSTDITAVHAGYAKWRRELLRAGVALYEIKPTAPEEQIRRAALGSSQSSLHAKSMIFDRERVFIGSFNLDPRSAWHNTELGFLIESPTTAAAIGDFFDTRVRDLAYELQLDDRGNLLWIERVGAQSTIHTHDPRTGFIRRVTVRLMSWLPIDWLL